MKTRAYSVAPLQLLFTSIVTLAALLALAAPALATKTQSFTVGSPGSLGGQFDNSGGIAINQAGTGGVPAGTFYVLDANNDRVQSFDADGNFLRAWGKDVIASSVNETQRLVVSASAGTFTLSFDGSTTASIPYNANLLVLDDALDVLPSVGGDANVTVTSSGPGGNRTYIVTFKGALAVTNTPQMTVATGSLTGSATVTTLADGLAAVPEDTGTSFEVCTIAGHCKEGLHAAGGGFEAEGGQFSLGGAVDGAIAVAQSSGEVLVFDAGDHRVQVFSATGAFLRTWGRDVNKTNGGAGFELCTVAADCKSGSSGSGAGTLSGNGGIATDAAGNVYVGDTGNRRIQKFTSAGAFLAAAGWDVVAPGGTGNVNVNEVQSVSVSGASGGELSLTFGGQTTDPVPHDAGAATVDATLEALSTIGAGNVTVTGPGGGPWAVEFTGALATIDVGPLTANPGLLEPLGVSLQNAAAGSFTLRLPAQGGGEYDEVTDPIPYNASAAAVQAALEAVAVIGAGNVTVSGPDGGPWQIDLFLEPFEGVAVGKMTANGSGLVGLGATATVSAPGATTATTTPGSGYEVCTLAVQCQAASSGTNPGQFDQAVHLAATATGDLFVTNQAGKVSHYTSTLAYDPGFSTAAPLAFQLTPAVNPADDHLFVRSGSLFFELDSATGALLATHPNPGNFGVSGLAANAASGRLYASNGSALVGVFADGPTLAVAAIGVTSPNSGTRATLNGNVFPNGAPLSDCRFEYVTQAAFATTGFTDLSSGGSAPCDPAAGSIPADPGPYAVAAGIGGLDPQGAQYQFRLIVENANGLHQQGGQFKTSDTVITQDATAVSGSAATLGGSVNPDTATISDCHFEYVTNAAFEATGFSDLSSGGSVPCDQAPGSLTGAAPIPVSATISGLQAFGAEYRFRLLATYPGGVVAAGKDRPIQTKGPLIKDTYAKAVGESTATLGAVINPQGATTSYRFQYTDEADFQANGFANATAAPVPDGPAGADGNDHEVAEQIAGFSPGVTYRFRVIATDVSNATNTGPDRSFTTFEPIPADTDCPNQDIREQQGSSHLPECRAYEMVSPPDKNGGDAIKTTGGRSEAISGPSRDGDSFGFCTTAVFGERLGNAQHNWCTPYLARRTTEGWLTDDPLPAGCRYDPGTGAISSRIALLDPNFERVVVRFREFAACPIEPLSPDAPLPSVNLYRQDLLIGDPASFELLAPQGAAQEIDLVPVGGSEDLSHVVYESAANQTAPPDSPPAGNYSKLYEWRAPGIDCSAVSPDFQATLSGCLRLVSVDPGGQPFASAAGVEPERSADDAHALGIVSADGERVFFRNPEPSEANGRCGLTPCNIYMREGGDVTFHVTASECGVACGNAVSSAVFRAAVPSGRVAFFSSCSKLTDLSAPSGTCNHDAVRNSASSGVKLYRWDRDADPGQRLTDLTADGNPADGTFTQPQLEGLIGASADGETVYFTAGEQLIAGEPDGGPGVKVYRWRHNGGSSQLDYLGTIDTILPSEANDWDDGNAPSSSGGVNTTLAMNRVSLDGTYLLIHTRTPLDPAADGDTDADAYRWSEMSGWTCLSCQQPSISSAGHVDIPVDLARLVPGDVGGSPLRSAERQYTMSADGSLVFFATPDALLSVDTNGESGCPGADVGFNRYVCNDIYEWRAPGTHGCQVSDPDYFARNGGCLSLISTGKFAAPIRLTGTTASGDEVFFIVRSRILGADFDENIDIYSARVDGGFPEPPPAEVPCDLSAGACEDPASEASPTPGAGTREFQGAVDPPVRWQTSRSRCPKGKRKVRRKGRTRCVTKAAKHRQRAAHSKRGAAR
jgi:hypothetical protein